jgi:hypothetical protein
MSDYPLEQLYPPDRFPHFQGPIASTKLSEVMYDVSGKTRVEKQLRTIAREELLACLRTNQQLTALLQEWSVNVGLPAIEHDIADFLDRVARRFGLARRGDLARHRRTPDTPIEDLLPEWYRLQDRLYTAYRRAGEVMGAAEACVRDAWQLPWLWLACRLAFDLFTQAHERALGVTFVRQRTSYLDDHVWGSYLPPVSFLGFKHKDWGLLDQAIQQFWDAAREIVDNMRAMAVTVPGDLPKGQWREDRERKTRRNVQWFYEYRICGKSAYEIAHARHANMGEKHPKAFPKSCSCRKTVTMGLKVAEQLLSG